MTTVQYSTHPDKSTKTQQLIRNMEDIHHHPDGAPKYLYHMLPTDILSKTKIVVVCPLHGEFTTLYNAHYTSKAGCLACAGKKQLTTEEWVARVQLVHPTYDFSKTVYKGRHHKVSYICPIHGEQEAYAKDLIKGHGCPECAKGNFGKPGSSILERISVAERMWTGKLDMREMYKVNSVNEQFIVECLTDPTHPPFATTLHAVSHGRGCPECNGGKVLNTEEFLTRLKQVHGDKYQVASMYTSAKKTISMLCPKHGVWETTPDRLLKGMGCPKCSENAPLTTSEFIRRSKLVWGDDTFDYSRVVYVNKASPVLLKCKEHDFAFKQQEQPHLQGRTGCLFCRRDPSRKARLYIIKCTGNGETFYKVGVTEVALKYRFSGDVLMPYDLQIVFLHPTTAQEAYNLESDIKRRIKDYSHYVPRIKFSGCMDECFTNISDIHVYFPDTVLTGDENIADPLVLEDLNWKPTPL